MATDRSLDMDPIVRKHEAKLNLNCVWNTHIDFTILEKLGKKISDRGLPVDPWVKYAKIALEEGINKNFYAEARLIRVARILCRIKQMEQKIWK